MFSLLEIIIQTLMDKKDIAIDTYQGTYRISAIRIQESFEKKLNAGLFARNEGSAIFSCLV
jgi:hypothetical protein